MYNYTHYFKTIQQLQAEPSAATVFTAVQSTNALMQPQHIQLVIQEAFKPMPADRYSQVETIESMPVESIRFIYGSLMELVQVYRGERYSCVGSYAMTHEQACETVRAYIYDEGWRLPLVIVKAIARNWGQEKWHFPAAWCPERRGRYTKPRDLDKLLEKIPGIKDRIAEADYEQDDHWLFVLHMVELLEDWIKNEMEAA